LFHFIFICISHLAIAWPFLTLAVEERSSRFALGSEDGKVVLHKFKTTKTTNKQNIKKNNNKKTKKTKKKKNSRTRTTKKT
jgi:hypothetical protein